ncbi:MAG: GFA family protein [Giesbergeria sp.]
MSDLKTGSCLCGRVSFSVAGALGAPDACHCIQCRKQSGHYFASANVPRAALAITGQESLSWYQSSAKVRRGFCSTCGSSLFWDAPAKDWIAIAMGAFDTPTSTQLAKHIFVAEKGDYYQINDDLPQNLHY